MTSSIECKMGPSTNNIWQFWRKGHNTYVNIKNTAIRSHISGFISDKFNRLKNLVWNRNLKLFCQIIVCLELWTAKQCLLKI